MKDKIEAVRAKELQCVKGWNMSLSAVMFLIVTTTTLLSVCTFTVYILLGNPLTPATVFSALYLMGFVQWPILNFNWYLLTAPRVPSIPLVAYSWVFIFM